MLLDDSSIQTGVSLVLLSPYQVVITAAAAKRKTKLDTKEEEDEEMMQGTVSTVDFVVPCFS